MIAQLLVNEIAGRAGIAPARIGFADAISLNPNADIRK
jgi:hypothetical protein